MTKKKRFGISEALTRGLSETINVVENNIGMYRNVVLPLSRVELDPYNPRKLLIDMIDVKHGIKPDDVNYVQKQVELEKLKELAHTIKANGVINPIVVYKGGELYRIVAGERRCLASILAGKLDIEARVFNEKPKAFELKLIQWVENTAREDLTLYERLENIRDIITEYCKQNDGCEVTATLLKNITGLSLSQTTYYMTVLSAPEDVQQAIVSGGIRNLDKAALIANIDNHDLRKEVTESCVNGASLKEMRMIANRQKLVNTIEKRLPDKTRGRVLTKINMGTTKQAHVIKAIIDSVLRHKHMAKYSDAFANINWNDLKDVNIAFRKLIGILEAEMAVE